MTCTGGAKTGYCSIANDSAECEKTCNQSCVGASSVDSVEYFSLQNGTYSGPFERVLFGKAFYCP